MTQTKKPLPIAVVVLPALIGAFILGRVSVSETSPELKTSEAPKAAQEREAKSPAPRTKLGPAPRSVSYARQPRVKRRFEPKLRNASSMPLKKALKVARAAFAEPNNIEVQETAKLAAGGLYLHLKNNPRDLAQSLDQLSTSNRQDEADFLAAVLGRIHDPIIERTALDLAERGQGANKAAAFDILDAFDTPAALTPALRALQGTESVAVRRAALRAIPKPSGLDKDTAEEVIKQLTSTLRSDEDPEARRRAALLLGDWQRSFADFWPVVEAMSQDLDINVRAGCAFACEISGLKDARIVNALAILVAKPGEDPLVRENAWRALGRLSPLPKSAEQIYLNFKQELEESGIGEDAGAG